MLPVTGAAVGTAVDDAMVVDDDDDAALLTTMDDDDAGFEDEVRADADEPDRITVDEADADAGDVQPRLFLGASDCVPGEPEPVLDAEPAPSMPAAGPPPLSAAAAAGTAKGWRAMGVTAFASANKLTTAFTTFFAPLPKAKEVPWVKQAVDFENTAYCDEEPDVIGPDGEVAPEGGLNKSYWHHMKAHDHDHDHPTSDEIMDPLWILFVYTSVAFWRRLAKWTDKYAAQVVCKLQEEDIEANRTRKYRPWENIAGGYLWYKLVNFFGILVYRGSVKTGDRNHASAWDNTGYDQNHGVYDQAVSDCMTQVEFEQFRRFVHFSDNDAVAEINARDSKHADYMPTQRLDLLLNCLNDGAARLLVVGSMIAIDEITGKSYVYGPSGLMKRTPGKKSSQGFQALAACSKMKVAFKKPTGTPYTVGVVLLHAFLWDLTKGYLSLLDPVMNVTCNVVLRLMHMSLVRGAVLSRRNVNLFMDNRFAQPRLLVILLASLCVFCTCTIRMNYFPLGKDLRVQMILPGWEAKTISDTSKKAFRLLPVNLCSWDCLTLAVCFDQGLTRMVTTRQKMAQQATFATSKAARLFTTLITRIKYALCRLYTDEMDPVDIEDHHRVMNACVLHSWKWTWSPILLMFDTIKTNCYTLHVLLCADFNERLGLEHDHKDYLRPLGYSRDIERDIERIYNPLVHTSTSTY